VILKEIALNDINKNTSTRTIMSPSSIYVLDAVVWYTRYRWPR